MAAAALPFMQRPIPLAVAATVLLHAALIAATVFGLSSDIPSDKPDEPLKVEILLPPPAPPPVIQPTPPKPLPAEPVAKKEHPLPKPQAEAKPVQQTRNTPPAQLVESAVETKSDARPAPAVAAPAPSPAPPAPAAPQVVARTSASEASYAATNRKPPYPRIALSNGDEGTVILRVQVTAEGTAGAVEIKKSSGFPQLDDSARRTVQTWRFKPATVDGKPVTEWYEVPIPFTLQNN